MRKITTLSSNHEWLALEFRGGGQLRGLRESVAGEERAEPSTWDRSEWLSVDQIWTIDCTEHRQNVDNKAWIISDCGSLQPQGAILPARCRSLLLVPPPSAASGSGAVLVLPYCFFRSRCSPPRRPPQPPPLPPIQNHYPCHLQFIKPAGRGGGWEGSHRRAGTARLTPRP